MKNIIQRVLSVLIVILLIGISIPSLSGKTTIKNNSDLLYDQDLSQNNITFNIKMRLAMQLAHMQSISACIIKNNTIVWSDNYGFSNRLLLEKPTINTNYMTGSISKVVTAAALMQLYEKGYFNLDDNVSKWLPFDFKNPKYPKINITFRMLLAHQSSLHDHDEISELQYLFSNKPYSFIEEILLPNGSDYHPEYWGDYPPGAGANYSNMAFILLGYLIERMTSQSYEQYVEENILKPLEMKNTSFNISKINKNNLAVPYFWFGGFYFRIPKTDFTFIDPAGGLYTTLEDLSHLLIMHLNSGVYKNNRILKNTTVEMMHKIQYPNSSLFAGLRFGLGWFIIPDQNNQPVYQGHTGDLICYHALMISRISDNTSIIYFYNSGNFPRILLPNLSLKLMQTGMKQVNSLLSQKADSI